MPARLFFGSRLRDDARGGDLDLLLEADQSIGLLQRARIQPVLEEQLAFAGGRVSFACLDAEDVEDG